MKKAGILLLAAMLILSLSGCRIKQRIENKIGEKISEKVLEGATDGKVNVDGDKVTIKGEDGTEVTLGGTEWPKGKLAKDLPEFGKGTIISVTESDEIVMVLIEGVEKKDFEGYWEEIKEDYTEEAISMEMEDVITYGGGDGKGAYVQVVYNTTDSTFTISATKKAE